MPSTSLHAPVSSRSGLAFPSNLPHLLQTPAGLAIVEIQGNLNIPMPDALSEPSEAIRAQQTLSPIGRLVFPLYDANADDLGSTAWMKRVYLYVGKHQRMTGEVKKLPKALAVVRRRQNADGGDGAVVENELEIAEIVKYKILFATRPEPVGE